VEHRQAFQTEEKTLALATEELKDMLQYGHLELADKTMDPGYIQHNPNVPQGRDGFKPVHEPRPRPRPEDAKRFGGWINPGFLTLIDAVVQLHDVGTGRRRSRRPQRANTTGIIFDLVRARETAWIQEAWDEAVIIPPRLREAIEAEKATRLQPRAGRNHRVVHGRARGPPISINVRIKRRSGNRQSRAAARAGTGRRVIRLPTGLAPAQLITFRSRSLTPQVPLIVEWPG